MREFIISELVKEVLGPRNGTHERMNGNPRDEYITGILAPYGAEAERNLK